MDHYAILAIVITAIPFTVCGISQVLWNIFCPVFNFKKMTYGQMMAFLIFISFPIVSIIIFVNMK